jgi:hypothetical protein
MRFRDMESEGEDVIKFSSANICLKCSRSMYVLAGAYERKHEGYVGE